jgi:BASS family bile acid:Na+ symporter
MTVDQIINLLVTVTLIEMMVAVGLGVTFADLARVVRDWRLVIRGALANYVCVPAATVGLLLLMKPHPAVAAGFLILAVCPGAPYGPPITAVANGNVCVAAGLMVILAGSSAVLAPILLRYLLPLMAGSESTQLDSTRLVLTLLATQLLPLSIGVAIRRWRPTLADRLHWPANVVSKLLNACLLATILILHFQLLTEIRPRGIAAMISLLTVSIAAGWLFSRADLDARKAMAITTALRNVGVGLVIASGMFSGTAAVTAVVAFGLVSLFGTLGFARLIGAVGPATPAIQVSKK